MSLSSLHLFFFSLISISPLHSPPSGDSIEHSVDLLLAEQRTGPLVEVKLKQLQVVVEEEGPRRLLKGKDV